MTSDNGKLLYSPKDDEYVYVLDNDLRSIQIVQEDTGARYGLDRIWITDSIIEALKQGKVLLHCGSDGGVAVLYRPEADDDKR